MPRELLTMTGTYTQFEGTNIVAENCLGARVRDLVIKGKTHIPPVPPDFIILDYIESTGTQYIDTGFKANTTTTKFVGAFTPTQQVMGALLGSRNGGQSGSHACNVFVLDSGKFRVDWANASYTGTEINYVVGTKYEMEITRGRLVINNTTKSYTNSTSVDQFGNFLIGTFNNITTPYADGFVGYIHECKLYSNGVLIRDFIPVKRISDNVVGMYDVVTKAFFTNAGTGEFIASTTVILDEFKSVAEEEDNILSIKINDYDVTNINLPIPLRSLPNGVCDTIENNQLIQRVGKIILDESNASNFTQINNKQVFRWGRFFNTQEYVSGICDKFPIKNVGTLGNENKGVRLSGSNNSGCIDIKLPNDTGFDINAFRTWLSENPITIYYELETQIIHNIAVPQLHTIGRTNVVTCDNNVKPVINCKLKLSKARITS